MYIESNEKMPSFLDEKGTVLILMDEKQVERDGVVVFTYEGLRVDKGFSYESLVMSLITERYDINSQIAIMNNHLLDDNDEEHEKEYIAMQNWRIEAKNIAREVVNALSV